MSSTAFNESLFEKKLLQLRETHESISNLSAWCLANQSHHTKLISIWLNVLKRVKIEHRLLLFYLANDIIQYSRRKHLPFVESFAPALQKATTMVREDSVKNKILRLFKIWDDRGIYDEAFLLDLSGLLICDPKGGNRMDIQDFHPNVMFSRIRSCKKLEDDTDIKLKILNESQLPITNVEKLRKSLKDREQGEDVMEDVENALSKIKAYVDALEAEIKERSGLLDMLDTGEQYYEKDLREAKIVVNAYKCFGQRVKQVQRKLEEKMPALPSPVPSPPDVNAPSPSPPMSPEEERESADFGACNFTMGESFINNTSIIEKALDSQGSTVYTDKADYFAPPVYTPSMTTGSGVGREVPYTPTREVTLNTSHYDSADTSYNSQFAGSETVFNDTINNSTYDEVYTDKLYKIDNARNSQYNSDSQLSNESYPAEYFIGANSSDASYPNESDERNLEPSVFSSLMDSKGTLLPPPPPPPPPKSPLDSESTDENKIEVIGGSTKQPSLAEILQSLIAKKEENPTTPLKPPPMPPTSLQEDEVWQENDWDSPLSPTPFQDFPAEDTDMRPKDIDHRNLISLTGWDSKNSDETSLDKDERAVRSKLYQDTDSSDSRSPPDHLPRLNLGPMDVPPPPIITTPDVQIPPPVNLPPTNLPPPNIPPPNLLMPNMPPPNRLVNHNNVPPPNRPVNHNNVPPPIRPMNHGNVPPLNRPMNHGNVPPPNRPMNHGNGPPPTRPMNHGNIPPMHVPPHLRTNNMNRLPPPLQPPPQFDFNGIRPHQDNPLDNVENIDMEMSDEEDRKETSPTIKRERLGLVPLTPNTDSKVADKSSPKTPSLPPPPSPNMSLLTPFPGPSPPGPANLGSPPVVELSLTPTRPPRPSMRMMGPPNQERAWMSPGFGPRQSHPMFQSPRQPFFNQGPTRLFRPRHFRPRFPPRW